MSTRGASVSESLSSPGRQQQRRMMNQALQSMSVMSAMRTGNVVWDVLLAMSLSVLVTPALNSAQRVAWLAWSRGGVWMQRLLGKTLQERIISYKERRSNTALDSDTQNQVLIKAIFLYVHHLGAADFLDTSHVQLTNLEGSSQQATARGLLNRSPASASGHGRRGGGGGGGGGGGASYLGANEGSLSNALMPYKIVKRPPENVWYPMEGHLFGGNDDNDNGDDKGGGGGGGAPVELNLSQEEYMESSSTYDDGGGGEIQQREMQRVFSLHVRSTSKAAVDDFIDKAYDWYLTELRKQDVNARYYYELCHVGGGGSTTRVGTAPSSDMEMGGGGGRRRAASLSLSPNNNRLQYKRYLLSETKTFRSLFFPEKTPLLELVHHFQHKTGKYAIEGYPHKLGLLLHGPPGTGKTSLIKALAQYTQRSVVNVPLSRIATNAELFSIFFNQTYHVEDGGNNGVPVRLHFKDVIFVMEDVDAASGVVLRRDNDKQQQQQQQQQQQDAAAAAAAAASWTQQGGPYGMMQPTPAPSHGGVVPSPPPPPPPTTTTTMPSPVTPPNTGPSPMPTTMTTTAAAASVAPTYHWNPYAQQQGQPPILFHTNNELPTEEIPDKLNLMGLLNVLDGVVDTPERIVVMTTNHPQMLDPALTRPGRIDKKLLLTYMEPNCMIDLLKHYFPSRKRSRCEDAPVSDSSVDKDEDDDDDDDEDFEDNDDDEDMGCETKEKEVASTVNSPSSASSASSASSSSSSSPDKNNKKKKKKKKRRRLVVEPHKDPDWVPQVRKVIQGSFPSTTTLLRMTPAEIEQMAAEQDTINGMIQALQTRRGLQEKEPHDASKTLGLSC